MDDRKQAFIRALAEFLAGEHVAELSIGLGMPEGTTARAHADRWARLRAATPLHGYPTVVQAEATLERFLA